MVCFKLRTTILGTIIASTVACASLGVVQTPEERVQSRAQARLDALMHGDFEEVFSYLAPALRDTTTWQRYGSRYAGVVNWKAASVESVACEPDRCSVNVSITYQMLRPKLDGTRSVEDIWIEVNGQWYLYDK